MATDAERAAQLEQSLIQNELERQLERHHVQSKSVRENLMHREPRWDAARQEVVLRHGYYSDQGLHSFLECLAELEPALFAPPERVGTNDVPIPQRKVILSTDQEAINRNWQRIAKGEVEVEDPPPLKPFRALAGGEIWEEDLATAMASGKVTLEDVSKGRVLVRSRNDTTG